MNYTVLMNNVIVTNKKQLIEAVKDVPGSPEGTTITLVRKTGVTELEFYGGGGGFNYLGQMKKVLTKIRKIKGADLFK